MCRSLRNSFVSRFALALALSATAQAAHAQSKTPSEGAQLWAAGPRKFGPVPYALVEAEALTDLERDAFRAAAFNRTVEETRRVREIREKGAPNGITENERSQAAYHLIDSLRVAQKAAVLDKRAVDEAKLGLSSIVAVVNYAASTKSKAILSIAGPAINDTLNKGVTSLANVEANYKASVSTAVELALLKADRETVAKWKATGITEANRKEAAEALFGANNTFFSEGIGKDLDPAMKTELQGVQIGLLKSGLDTVVARQAQGETALRAFERQTEARFTQQKVQIQKVVGEVQTLRKVVANQIEAVDLLAKNTKAQIESLEGRLDSVSEGQRATQAAMLRSMGPRDRLLALQDPAFLPPKTPEEKAQRAEDIKNLARFNRVMSIKDGLDEGLSGIGAAAGFAVSLGVQIDTVNLNRNINTAKSALNFAASLATGNYVGALMSAGGLFGGGGGEDGTTVALGQISKKLDEVIELQKMTLARIEELSEKIDLNHAQVMSKLQVIEHKIDQANKLLAVQDAQPYSNCRSFMQMSAIKGIVIRSGVYASYAKRIEHFAADQEVHPPGFAKSLLCFEYLRDTIIPGQAPPASPFETAIILRASTWEAGEVGTPKSTKARLDAMWRAHHAVLGWSSVDAATIASDTKQNCVNRALSKVAGLPGAIASLQEKELSCQGIADISKDAAWAPLRGRGGDIVGANVIKDPYSPKIAAHFGELVLFLTPFFELAVSTPDGKLRLPKPKELTSTDAAFNDGKRRTNSQTATWIINSYAEQLSLAIAQEGIIEGAALVPSLARVMSEAKFGAGSAAITKGSLKKELAAVAGIDISKPPDVDSDHCLVTTKAWQEKPLLVAACLMESNPVLARNVGRYLAVRDLQAKAQSAPSLAFAYVTSSSQHLQEVFPSLSTLNRADPARPTSWQWSYTINGLPTQSMSFPMVSEVTSGFLERGPNIERLTDLRDRFELRALANKADEDLSKPSPTLSDRQREIARYYLRQGARRQETLISTSLTEWGTISEVPGAKP